jgi:hypothetical protein
VSRVTRNSDAELTLYREVELRSHNEAEPGLLLQSNDHRTAAPHPPSVTPTVDIKLRLKGNDPSGCAQILEQMEGGK